jgi:hypothetical protein
MEILSGLLYQVFWIRLDPVIFGFLNPLYFYTVLDPDPSYSECLVKNFIIRSNEFVCILSTFGHQKYLQICLHEYFLQ